MRTTIRLDEGLLREIKALAARTDRTVTAIVDEALRELVSREARATARRRASIPVAGAGGLRPGVDLNDSAGLLDLMEGPVT